MMETVITLLIVSLFMPIVLSVFTAIAELERFPYEAQDQIALAQLRRFLNGCAVKSVDVDELVCMNDKTWRLRASSENLYLSEGTIIVLSEIDGIYFDVVDGLIWLYYLRHGKWKVALIGQV